MRGPVVGLSRYHSFLNVPYRLLLRSVNDLSAALSCTRDR